MNSVILSVLCCPQTHKGLHVSGHSLAATDGKTSYPLSSSGIPLFAGACFSPEGKIQERHYDKVAEEYLGNLGYIHTDSYISYLNQVLLKHMEGGSFDTTAELCCGNGEGLKMMREKVKYGIGMDVSCSMLENAKTKLPDNRFQFLQADATMLPLKDSSVDSVIMLGGIHHVKNRLKLFSEVKRVLKPGGRLYWREPVNDFPVWKWLRYIIYRLSPALDFQTESPLEYRRTRKQLRDSGLDLKTWKTCGFLAFALFMNSDVLIITRLFKFLPGVEILVKLAAKLDEFILDNRFFKSMGFLVVGMAEKRRV